MVDKITSFAGKYKFLSNFYITPVEFEGSVYPSSEHAFQAAKALNPVFRNKIRKMVRPAEAKKFGRTVSLRPRWEEIKIDIMRNIVRKKFENKNLRKRLLATGAAILYEGNHWGDRFWGVDDNTLYGKNWLGKILMQIRDEITRNKER